MDAKKGAMLVLATAIISGFSVWLNKLAIEGTSGMAFTALKAVVVSCLLIGTIILFSKFREIKALNSRQWLGLFVVGVVGGSTAFLLFFQGLAITSAVNAAFLQKTLFIFASAFAFFLLKEKIDKRLLLAGILAFAALVVLFGMNLTEFNIGDLMVLCAALLWGLEIVIAKKLLKGISGTTVAFGRMLFGAIIMLAFLAFTGQLNSALEFNGMRLEWLAITGAFLFAYVMTFYNGLKSIEVSKATLLLLFAIPITSILSIYNAKPLGILQIAATALLIFGILLAFAELKALKKFFTRIISWKT